MAEPANTDKVDWCYRSESTTLLSLSIAQIHMSLTEGDNSVNTLMESFQELANTCIKFESIIDNNKQGDGSALTEISAVAEHMSDHINSAIVAFQFYDRLCQRIEHVAKGLDELSLLLGEEGKINDSQGWKGLRDHIKDLYTMKEEFIMFEAIMQGASAKEALLIYKNAMETQGEQDDDGDVELF